PRSRGGPRTVTGPTAPAAVAGGNVVDRGRVGMTETALGAPGAEHALPSAHVTDGRPPGPGKVVVVGQGPAGLRLALQGVRAGHLVIGVDRDVRRRGRIGAGISGLDAAVDAELAAALRV